MHKNPVVLWELASHDSDMTAEFLRRVFDWDIEMNPRLGFYTMDVDPRDSGFEGGGVFTLKKAKLPFITIYIQLDDIQEKARAVAAAGGYIVEGPTELPGGSWICLFNEPSGVTLAMLQSRQNESDE